MMVGLQRGRDRRSIAFPPLENSISPPRYFCSITSLPSLHIGTYFYVTTLPMLTPLILYAILSLSLLKSFDVRFSLVQGPEEGSDRQWAQHPAE